MNISPLRRKFIQIAAFGFTNFNIGNFATGKLYQGSWKQFCAPGLNCYSCPAAGFACPIGALQAVIGDMNFKFSFYVIGFLMAFGVVFGRFICGFLCPFGLFQEIISRIPLPKFRLPFWAKYIKYFILAIFVVMLPITLSLTTGVGDPAFCKYICPAGILEGGFPLIATIPALRTALGWLFNWKLTILFGVMAACLFVHRFFCKVLCPLGAIYGFFNKISPCGIKLDKPSCVKCGKCAKVCPMDVDPSVKPDSMECIRCGKCVNVCPTKALDLQFYRKYAKIGSKIS